MATLLPEVTAVLVALLSSLTFLCFCLVLFCPPRDAKPAVVTPGDSHPWRKCAGNRGPYVNALCFSSYPCWFLFGVRRYTIGVALFGQPFYLLPQRAGASTQELPDINHCIAGMPSVSTNIVSLEYNRHQPLYRWNNIDINRCMAGITGGRYPPLAQCGL